MQAAASILYGGDSQDCLSLQALVSGQEGQNPGSPIESLPFPIEGVHEWVDHSNRDL